MNPWNEVDRLRAQNRKLRRVVWLLVVVGSVTWLAAVFG